MCDAEPKKALRAIKGFVETDMTSPDTKELKPCPQEYWIKTTAKDGTELKRRIRCCRLRGPGGFMIKDWKCLGREHKDCPLNAKSKTWPAKKKEHDKALREMGA